MTQLCADRLCQCRGILLRTYSELRAAGYDDRNAFQAAAHVLTLRHPGHDRDYYSALAAKWIEAETDGARPLSS